MPRLIAILAAALLAPAAQASAAAATPPAAQASASSAAAATPPAAQASASSAAAATPPAIEGSWTVRAKVVSAEGGARPPEGARRRSVYHARDCSAPCKVRLAERLPGGGRPVVAFTRSGRVYSGTERTRLRCASGRVRARVTDRFQISRRVQRAGRRLAANLSGKARILGSCGGTAAELVVRWSAERSDLPEPPTPSFSSGPDPVSLTTDGGIVTFVDASTDDLDGGRIVRWEWDFGDPASGAANTASGEQVTHRYTVPGTFTVQLTVTDNDGLAATVSDVVSVDP
jgi:hypothetical protein